MTNFRASGGAGVILGRSPKGETTQVFSQRADAAICIMAVSLDLTYGQVEGLAPGSWGTP